MNLQYRLKDVWHRCNPFVTSNSSTLTPMLKEHTLAHLRLWLLSEEEASHYRDECLDKAFERVVGLVHCELNHIQWSAILSYYFRVGEDTFIKSSVLRALNERNLYQVAQALLQYTTHQTTPLQTFNFEHHTQNLYRCYLEHQAFVGYEDEVHCLKPSSHEKQAHAPRWVAEAPHASIHMGTDPKVQQGEGEELEHLLEALKLKLDKTQDIQMSQRGVDVMNQMYDRLGYRAYEILDVHPED